MRPPGSGSPTSSPRPTADAGTEFVQFSPKAELEATMAAVQAAMAQSST